MTLPLTYLAWTLLLAIVQVLAAAGFKRQQDGLQWAAGNRDDQPKQYTGTAARLARAQANLFESLPIFVGAVLLAHVAARETVWTAWGAGLFFWARLAYVPVYAIGLSPLRSIVWGVALIGLIITVVSVL